MDLIEAEAALGVAIPPAARRVYDAGDGRYRVDGQWWVIWQLARLVDDNVRAWADGTLPRGLLAIGHDGAGDAFCVRLTGEDDVVRWSFIALAVERSEGSLDDFAAEWVRDE